MPLFLSTYLNKVDKKGRVSVPAPFRAALEETEKFQGIVAFRSHRKPAIEGWGIGQMERISLHMDEMDLFSDVREDVSVALFAQAQPLAFDPEGRILLTQDLLNHAHIEGSALFAGKGSTFQIWNPAHFQAYEKEASSKLKAHLDSLNIKLHRSEGGRHG
jgi:MraZ protein